LYLYNINIINRTDSIVSPIVSGTFYQPLIFEYLNGSANATYALNSTDCTSPLLPSYPSETSCYGTQNLTDYTIVHTPPEPDDVYTYSIGIYIQPLAAETYNLSLYENGTCLLCYTLPVLTGQPYYLYTLHAPSGFQLGNSYTVRLDKEGQYPGGCPSCIPY
jgi:hypothetical protein